MESVRKIGVYSKARFLLQTIHGVIRIGKKKRMMKKVNIPEIRMIIFPLPLLALTVCVSWIFLHVFGSEYLYLFLSIVFNERVSHHHTVLEVRLPIIYYIHQTSLQWSTSSFLSAKSRMQNPSTWLPVYLIRSLTYVLNSGVAHLALLRACQPIQSAYTYSTGNMQLISAENGSSHTCDFSSKANNSL